MAEVFPQSSVEVNLLGNPGCGDETTGQVMLLACRCLYNVVDILQGAQELHASWAKTLGRWKKNMLRGRETNVPPLVGIDIPIRSH